MTIRKKKGTKQKQVTLTNTTSVIGVKRYLAVDVEFVCC